MLLVLPASPDCQQRAEAISQQYDLPLSSEIQALEPGNLLLWISQQGIGLRPSGKGGPKPVYVDFLSGNMGHRKRQAAFRNELICKAMGIKTGRIPTVFDATAGFGRDAFILASLGCDVTLMEKHPVVALVLKDGIQRACEEELTAPIMQRMQLLSGNAVDYMQSAETTVRPDAVYLDPMFPERQKSAKVKKDMQVLQHLLGHGESDENLLSSALAFASKRVVVKRPRNAPNLSGAKPSHSILGKSSRFDVYLTG